MIPRQLGPIRRSAVAAGKSEQLALSLPPLLPGLREAGRDHDQAVDALGRAVEDHVGHRVRRHRDDRDVDLVGDRRDGRVGRHARDRVRGRVDHVDAARVVAEHQVADQRLPDRVLTPGRADHGDAAGVEERRDRRRLGPVLAVLHHADGGVGGVDREHQVQHALVVPALDPVAGVAEDLDHLDVLGQHLGHEPVDAVLAAGLGEVLEQELGDAATLVLVLDQERHLGLARRHDVVAPDRDHPARHGEHERDPFVVVDGAEPGDVALGQPWASGRRSGGTSTRRRPGRRS